MCQPRVAIKYAVAAAFFLVWNSGPSLAENARLERLYAELQTALPDRAEWVANQIREEWGKSGSAAMDLLLSRGLDAIAADDAEAAAGHLTALIDHAPEFAEGYAVRARAYLDLGLYGPALDDLRSALALEPRHFGAMQGVAVILEQAGQEQQAVEMWRLLQEVYPGSPTAAEALDRLGELSQGHSI